jgi:hypothetical protein
VSIFGDVDAKLDGLFGGLAMPASRRADPRAQKPDVAAVPRPIRPSRPGLIDLSTAPSSMEQMAEKWRGR